MGYDDDDDDKLVREEIDDPARKKAEWYVKEKKTAEELTQEKKQRQAEMSKGWQIIFRIWYFVVDFTFFLKHIGWKVIYYGYYRFWLDFIFGVGCFPGRMEVARRKREEDWKEFREARETRFKKPFRLDRVREEYYCAEVDTWVRLDKEEELKKKMQTNYVAGDKVKYIGVIKYEGIETQTFTVHDVNSQGLILSHPGGAFKHSVKNEDVERA
jgi:hypothetical protein